MEITQEEFESLKAKHGPEVEVLTCEGGVYEGAFRPPTSPEYFNLLSLIANAKAEAKKIESAYQWFVGKCCVSDPRDLEVAFEKYPGAISDLRVELEKMSGSGKVTRKKFEKPSKT